MLRIIVKVSIVAITAIYMFAVSSLAQEVNKPTSTQYLQTASLSDSELGSHLIPGSDRSRDNKSLLAKEYNELGVTYSKQGQYNLAIVEFDKALEIDPVSTEAYNDRGITYSKMGKYDLAISDFSKSLDKDPKDAKVLYNRGLTYAIEGQLDRALADLRRCLEYAPSDSDAYDTIGRIYEELACSDWAQACKYGNCVHLNEAKRLGVCSDISTINSKLR